MWIKACALMLAVLVLARATVVQTRLGPVSGTRDPATGTTLFLGIPYAQPPVGSLRWNAPVQHAPWTATRACTSFGHMCPQLVDAGGYTFPRDATFDEDCLSLNVYVGASNSSALRPVFVWFHGGALAQGGSYENRLWGVPLAQQGVLVVTANYRLGAAGFLSDPLQDPASTGAFGLQDQQLVLRFVRDSIAAFGGDPARVTIAGESAGGSSVTYHLIAPASRGLFHGAVVQSGAPIVESAPATRTAQHWRSVYAAANCSDYACMQALPWRALLDAQLSSSIKTVITANANVANAVLPPVFEALQNGLLAPNVSILAGNTHNEGTLFTAVQHGPMNLTAYRSDLYNYAKGFGVPSPTLFENLVSFEYPCPASSNDCYDAYCAAVGDVELVCNTNCVLHAAASRGNAVYAYDFNVNPSWVKMPWAGAFHSSDIEFVFGTLLRARGSATAAELALSARMTSAWANFTSRGAPGPLADWPPFSASNGWSRVMLQTTGQTIVSGWKEKQCAFWNKFVYSNMPQK